MNSKIFSGKRPFMLTLILLCTLLLGSLPPTAHASCGGSTSVRNTNQLNDALKAFNNANSGCGTFTITLTSNITLSEGMREISNSDDNTNLVIDGAGFTLNGDRNKRQLVRINRGTVQLKNLDLTDGKEAGVRVDNNAQVTLTNSSSKNNKTNGVRVASQNAKAIIIDSTISSNTNNGVSVSRGTVRVETSYIGGNDEHGIYADGESTTRVQYSLIVWNSKQGVRSRNGTTTILSSTIAYNSESGVSNGREASPATSSDLNVHNSTINNNGADGITRVKGDLNIVNSTIVNNHADGVNIYRQDDVKIYNSILYDNQQKDCRKRNDSSGFFFLEIAIMKTHTNCGNNSVITDDPLLNALGDYGGGQIGGADSDLTLTVYQPKKTSPAIDGGNNHFAETWLHNAIEAYDQRGEDYERIVGGTVDIGAVERQDGGLSGTAVMPTTGNSSATANFSLILILGGILLLGMVGVVVRQRRV